MRSENIFCWILIFFIFHIGFSIFFLGWKSTKNVCFLLNPIWKIEILRSIEFDPILVFFYSFLWDFFYRKILRIFYYKIWTGQSKTIMEIYFCLNKDGVTILRVILFKFVVDIWGVNKSEFIADFEVDFEANFLHHWLSKQKSKKNR